MVKLREDQLGGITVLDEDGYGIVTASMSRIVDVLEPIDGYDAVNKNYLFGTVQSHIYVDANNGSDYNDGLSSVTALETINEARRRIGDKNGNVTIWLMGEAGVTQYTIGAATDEDNYAQWSLPRKGSGLMTIRSDVINEIETYNVISSTYVSSAAMMVYTIDATLSIEEHTHSFLQIDSNSHLESGGVIVFNSETTICMYTQFGDLGTPSTVTVWRPGIALNVNTPEVLRCGAATGVDATNYFNSLELINLEMNATVIEQGSIKPKWVRFWSGAFKNVSIISDFIGYPVAFPYTTNFYYCETPFEPLIATFGTPQFFNCGGGSYSFSDNSPFKIKGLFYSNANIIDSRIEFFGLCTGDVLGLVKNSIVQSIATVRGYRGIDGIYNSSVNLSISEYYDDNNPDFSGLSLVWLYEGSKLNITFNDVSPDLDSFGGGLQNSILVANTDLSNNSSFASLDLSDSSYGYAFPDGSIIARENANLSHINNVVGRNSFGIVGYSSDITPSYTEFFSTPDTGASFIYHTIPSNKDFEDIIVINMLSDNDIKYKFKYRVVGTSGASAIDTMSAERIWGATDDDLSDDPATEINITFTINDLQIRCTVGNNIGGGIAVHGNVYFSLEYYKPVVIP